PAVPVVGTAIEHLHQELRVVLAEEPEQATPVDVQARERHGMSTAGQAAALRRRVLNLHLEPPVAGCVVDAEHRIAGRAGTGCAAEGEPADVAIGELGEPEVAVWADR